MANEIVKYDPELNNISLRKFTATEMNLFFSIVSRMRDQGSKIVRFKFDQLKELSNYKPTANKRFLSDIEKTYDHLMSLHFGKKSRNGLNIEKFVIFTMFKINGEAEEPYVDIKVHSLALPLLNNLERWVRYALLDFRNIKSTYSKTMFRILKQYRTTGFAELKKSDFNDLLDIPKSYKEGQINRDVINPIKEELSPLFKGLYISKRYSRKKGRPVIGYKFTWKPELKDADDFYRGEKKELESKIFNVKNNSNLTIKEKNKFINKLINNSK